MAKKQATQQVIAAYKGFDKDLKCRGYQFEAGKEYAVNGKIVTCENGFHSCEHPLAVLSHYPLCNGNRYAQVDASGDVAREEQKLASRSIKIKAEIGISGLIKAAVAWTSQQAQKPTSGYYAHSATSGNYANSATSGYYVKTTTKGVGAIAANAGSGSAAAGIGGAIFIVERDSQLNIIAVFASKVGDNGIKPDVLYVLRDGKPVEE